MTLKGKIQRQIKEHIKKMDVSKMEKAACDMDKIADELKKEGNQTGWDSTKELHKHRYGKSYFSDVEAMSLGDNPGFMAIIERSRERYRKEGGIPLEEVRRRLGTEKQS
jgi:hypothetical protein